MQIFQTISFVSKLYETPETSNINVHFVLKDRITFFTPISKTWIRSSAIRRNKRNYVGRNGVALGG